MHAIWLVYRSPEDNVETAYPLRPRIDSYWLVGKDGEHKVQLSEADEQVSAADACEELSEKKRSDEATSRTMFCCSLRCARKLRSVTSRMM